MPKERKREIITVKIDFGAKYREAQKTPISEK